jgi:hypothetical protein
MTRWRGKSLESKNRIDIFSDFDIPHLMKIKTLHCKPASIATTRWAAYAATGAATSLAAIPAAEGEIHYSGIINQTFSGDAHLSTANLQLNGSAHLHFAHFSDAGGRGANFAIVGSHSLAGVPIGNYVGNLVNSIVYLSNLASRMNLSDLRFNRVCHATTFSGTSCEGAVLGSTDEPNGHFQEPGKGFIGFVFDTADGPQYGWARIKGGGAPAYRFVVVDYAWADPDESIKTGQKRSSQLTKAVPKTGSLGLLALGGAGLIAWRKRKGEAGKIS